MCANRSCRSSRAACKTCSEAARLRLESLARCDGGAARVCPAALLAVEPSEMLKDPALEARAREIGQALRCVVCQNQSIDDSAAEVARDMRRAVRERLSAGDSDAQVFDFMVARYGDYVLLKPPFKLGTLAAVAGRAAGAADRGGRHHADGLAAPRHRALAAAQRRGARAAALAARPLMLEFLLALLTTATVGALLVPLLRSRVDIDRAASTASSRSIATSSPRSSASAPRGTSQRERSRGRAHWRSSAASSLPPTPTRRRARHAAPTPCIACCRPRLRWRSRCWPSAST